MKPIYSERVLQTNSFLIEPILPSHAEKLFNFLQAEELYTFVPTNPPKSINSLEERYKHLLKRQSPDGNEVWLNYAIFGINYNSYVGTLQATIGQNGKTYIAYEIFPCFWRKGIAKEACSALINHLFKVYLIDTITAHLDTRNIASFRLLESLGFKQVQIIKEADSFKGDVIDEFVFELNINTN